MRHLLFPILLALPALPACTTAERSADDDYVVRAVQRSPAPSLWGDAAPTPAPPAPARPLVLPESVDIAPFVAGSAASDKELEVAADADRTRASFRYDYKPATVYQIQTAVGFLTTVVFEKGEQILSRAAGDTERWMVEEVPVGTGVSVQPTLIIKPTRAPLATNMVVTTNKRLYQLELLASDAGQDYQSLVMWRYADSLAVPGRTWAELTGTEPAVPGADAAREAEAGIPIDVRHLDFDYKISLFKTKRRPPWAPIQIFHDGQKTYIRFPDRVTQTEAPPFFVRIGEEDQIVNYRVIGDLYVVDRVVDVGILKIGEKKAQQVLISYAGDFFGNGSRR